MTSPSVTVAMPVYNSDRYVEAAANSILTQTQGDFEFLIVDDGSTDDSLPLLRRLAERDSRIRLVSRPNTGYVIALNEMLGMARGEFFARMDADDIALPGRLGAQLDYLRNNPDCVAVGCRIQLIDADGDVLCTWTQPRSHEDIDAANLGGAGGAMGHPATTFRTAAVRCVGGYRAEYEPAEDLDLYLRMAEVGRLANLPDLLFYYRRHPNAVGVAQSERQEHQIDRVVREARRRRGIPGEPPSSPGVVRTAADVRRMWAWWAWADGNRRTARKHAWGALRLSPWSPESWRVAYCAFLAKSNTRDESPQRQSRLREQDVSYSDRNSELKK